MDAFERNQLTKMFTRVARQATDDMLTFALNDIREALAVRSQEVLEGDAYVEKLMVERDVYLTEAGRRVAKEYLRRMK